MQNLKRVGVLLLVLTLTLSTPMSFVSTTPGTVAAQTSTSGSDFNSAKCDLLRGPFFLATEVAQSGCDKAYSALDNLEADATADELHSNIYIQAEVMNDDIERSTVEIKDESGRSKQLMLDEGLYQFIKCYNRGGAVSECKSEGLDGIDSVAGSLERKLIESQNLHAIQTKSQINRIRSQSNLQEGDVFAAAGDIDRRMYYENETVTTLDGNEVNTTQIYLVSTYSTALRAQSAYTYNFKNQTLQGNDINIISNTTGFEDDGLGADASQTTILAPESFSTVESLTSLNHKDYRRTHDQILQDRALARSNFNDIADLYAKEFERGEVDASDVLSPFFLADRLSQNADNIDPQQAQQIWAQQQGLTTDSSSSYVIDYTQSDGTTRTDERGSLAISSSEMGTLERGKSYDTANYTGKFYFYPDDSQPSQQVQLTGTFEIVEIKTLSESGEVTGNTSSVNVSNDNPAVETTSTDELRRDIERKVNNYENRTKIINNYSDSSGVFAGLGDINAPNFPELPGNIWMLLGVAIAALAIVPRLLDSLLDIIIPFR